MGNVKGSDKATHNISPDHPTASDPFSTFMLILYGVSNNYQILFRA